MRDRAVPGWLSDAVIYQIYPQSFADSDGDGIGDLPGVLARLDHLSWLGVNVIWFNPLFASPFGDAGYDVSDYFTIAPRYGTEQDLIALVKAARERGIRVMLDLVPGHTSDRHAWFRASADDPGDDRYIWSETRPSEEWVPSTGARQGFYLPNFYPVQPALNFGYARMNPDEPWRRPVDAPGPAANRAALREIIAYWLDLGVSGFRVDMAFSLVKDDPERRETARLWNDVRAWLDTEYPDCALLAEWGDPKTSVPAGFHADFFLHAVGPVWRSLWGNAEGSHRPEWGTDPCFFAPDGRGSPKRFLAAWDEARDAIGGAGHVALPTANHDFSRLVCGSRTASMVAPAFAFLLTWPSLPTIYYGDEIGMRYVPGLPDKEGSQCGPEARQGSRTPMQWDASPNAGFSTAPAGALYLPIDPDPDRPTVEAQRAAPGSLLHQVRALITARRTTPALGTSGTLRVVHDGYPLIYVRGGTHLVVINPRQATATAPLPQDLGMSEAHCLVGGDGVKLGPGGEVSADGFSYGVYRIPQACPAT
ncbi:alpha-amylase family glycosyl hydrolase [Sphaerisporangium fuscum]|uniref:alpha-amylase family glycosyl hydrolase n=1 Tax=Sphaerisporangium fuscum TaxID=2835868 RepID=UPI001BDCFB8C|nr:alpha-amylase family glycosyl hydrolase [Sphaerisporangium fuscum]